MLMSQGHFVAARQLLQSFVQSKGTHPTPELYCLWAETYLSDLEVRDSKGARTTDAEDGLRRALELDPECGRAYKDLAFFSNLRGDYKMAVQYGTRAIESKKPDASGWLQRGSAYAHLQQPEKALKDMNVFLSSHKASGIYYTIKGDMLVSMKRWSEAIEAYKVALNSRSGFHNLNLNKIIKCYEAQNKLPEAIAALNEGIKDDPEIPQFLATRGRLEKELKDYKSAISDYSRAIENEPTSKYYRERAEVYSLMGNKELAAQDLRSADK